MCSVSDEDFNPNPVQDGSGEEARTEEDMAPTRDKEARYFFQTNDDFSELGLLVRFKGARINIAWEDKVCSRQYLIALVRTLPEGIDRCYRERDIKRELSEMDNDLDDLLGETE